ncbi:FidL-like protein [Photobacterium sanguinicancri]|uniref:FidL-like protein n=1 Tax=Photobacterium sanguinicancri TaxID=875932 RepID=UPI0026E335EB|nr:FidL-like protein [Photobacterium sanguinicancri]MDO6500681.1 FidL-like protein [Photobacterium sanguinicancri]
MHSNKGGKIFFFYALILFLLCTLPFLAKVMPENSGEMKCTARAIMHFEDTDTETVNVNVHFHFAVGGKGSMVVEGYSDSKAGWLYLQRYVKFEYYSQRVSDLERMYKVKSWSSSKSSIDEAPDVIFDYFMREMSDSNHALQIQVQQLNHDTVLLSSINSPLFVCAITD